MSGHGWQEDFSFFGLNAHFWVQCSVAASGCACASALHLGKSGHVCGSLPKSSQESSPRFLAAVTIWERVSFDGESQMVDSPGSASLVMLRAVSDLPDPSGAIKTLVPLLGIVKVKILLSNSLACVRQLARW